VEPEVVLRIRGECVGDVSSGYCMRFVSPPPKFSIAIQFRFHVATIATTTTSYD